MQMPQMQQMPVGYAMPADGFAELKAEIERLRHEQEIAERVAAARAEAQAAAEAKAAQHALEAKVEAEFARLRAENRPTYIQTANKNTDMEALGVMLVDAIRKATGTHIVAVQGMDERPALPEGGMAGGIVPGAITTTTTTTTVDASGRGEEKPVLTGNVETIPEAEGLFNRRGKKSGAYDPDNFYNFFDEQEKK